MVTVAGMTKLCRRLRSAYHWTRWELEIRRYERTDEFVELMICELM